jgi:hypothetical protein
MRKYLGLLSLLVLMSCKTNRDVAAVDDVYANPAAERRKAEAARQTREVAKPEQPVESPEPARESSYNPDDYYDFAYASRINRFHHPLYGAGYYDPYYTNYYTYTGNPALYGTSIYFGLNSGMPSYAFSRYSFGISTMWGAPYDPFYNPYSPYYDPWMSYYDPWYSPWGYQNPYMYGYNAGYYNGWNSARWNYFNSLDPNSYRTVAPRHPGGGGNTGVRGYQPARQYMNGTEDGNPRPRFTEMPRIQQREAVPPQQQQPPQDRRRPAAGTRISDPTQQGRRTTQPPPQERNEQSQPRRQEPTPRPVPVPRGNPGGGNRRPR